jgi:hypothetical protein
MNIQDYFALKLEGAQLEACIGADEMPADSNCGKDCMGAIDSAAMLLNHLRAAGGHDWPFHAQSIIDACETIVSIYICG